MWTGLNWLIKDSVALIACIIVEKKEQREEERREGVCQRDPPLVSPQ